MFCNIKKHLLLTSSRQINSNIVRYLSEKKKFYQEARICHTDGGYEVNLDQRKLRTKSGKILKLPNECLAHAVATEWNMQKEAINLNQMPITSLCYSATENFTEKAKESLILSALKYLSTDTVLCRVDEPHELAQLQKEKWDPLIDWLRSQYPTVSVKHAVGFGMPNISPDTYAVLTKNLQSYTYASVVGFESMANLLKSVILSFAIVDRYLTIENAVSLSRLEQEYQTSKWGNVEWHHDIELHETQMNTAACALFIQLNSCEEVDAIKCGEKLML